MSSIGSTGGKAAPAPRPTPRAARPSQDDARAMGRAFDQARGGDGKAKLGGRSAKGEKLGGAELARLKQEAAADVGEAGHQPPVAALAERGARYGTLENEGEADSGQGLGIAQSAQPPVVVAMPDMPAPHVDAAAFAQLMTQLWLRERGKGTREVTVTFGDDAWPATGARLVRNAAGALDIQLHVADRGALYGEDRLADLGRDLADRGLAVGAIGLDEGGLA